MSTVTQSDTTQHHIHVEFQIADHAGSPLSRGAGEPHEFSFPGVIDTGVPWTEFSDESLARAGLTSTPDPRVPIKPELQTQKYAKIVLPSISL